MGQDHLNVHEIWRESTAATAKLLTTSYVATEGVAAFSVDPFNVMQLSPVMSGTALTSLDLLIETSVDNTNWNPLPTQVVSAALITADVGEVSMNLDGSSRMPSLYVDVTCAKWVRVSAKRTGGDATSAAIIYATFGIER